MKTSSLKASALIMLMAIIAGWLLSFTATAASHQDKGDKNYIYHSAKLNLDVAMPTDWRDKVSTKEDDQTITVTYNNAGGQPVFLYSITKIPEQTWMNIKDGLNNYHIVAHKEGQVYIVQFTDKNSIKGANAQEYKAIVANLNDVLANIKIG